MKVKKRKIVNLIALSFILTFILTTGNYAGGFDGWRVMPVRSEEEFNLGMIGREAMQHMHGIARSASNPDIIYTAHDVGQIWKSTDAGETWEKPLGKNLSLICGQSIEVDPVNPNIVFVIVAYVWNWLATDYEGLYRSKDGGDTWEFVLQTQTNFSNIHNMYTHNIAYDPSSVTSSRADRWYVAFPNNGLYWSENGGDTWNMASNLSGHTTIYAVQTHPNDGQTVYVASSEGLFVSYSQGSNLQSLGNLPEGDVSSIAINPQNPNIIYAVVKDNGLYNSSDGGSTFSLLKSFDAVSVFINPGYPDVIYLVGTDSNAIISHDGGDTWIKNMETVPAPGFGRPENTWLGKIVGALTGIVPNPNDPDEAVAFSRGTFWKTTDGGQTFVDSSTLFTGYAWSWWNDGIAFDPFNPDRFATFNCDVGPRITNNASNYFYGREDVEWWRWYTNGLIPYWGTHAGDFQPVPDSQIMVASIGLYWRTQLMRSTDGGRSWQLVTQGSENEEQNLFIAFHPDEPNLVFAGRKVSYDAGTTFTKVDFGEFNAYNPSILGMCRAHPDTIYALDGERYRILRSDDRGATWYLYAQPGWRFRRLDPKPTFAVDPVDPNKVYTLDSSYDLAVYDGNTWRKFGVLALAGGSELKNFVRTVAIDPNRPEIIYAGMEAAGIPCAWRSVDGGYTWEDITYNLPRGGLSAMAVNPHTGEVFIGSACGTRVLPPPYESSNLIYDKLLPTTFAPIASIVATPSSGEVPLEVIFDGSDSYDKDGSIISYKWDFGDGTTSTRIRTRHIYTSAGEYTVTLSVTDDQGHKGKAQTYITVFEKAFGEMPAVCYNNVFNPTKGERALIIVELLKKARVKLGLYNTKGNRIRELTDEEKEVGKHKYYWDGKNDSGNVVGSGLYFVHIEAGDYEETKKIVVVK